MTDGTQARSTVISTAVGRIYSFADKQNVSCVLVEHRTTAVATHGTISVMFLYSSDPQPGLAEHP
jgi:hypothetical protein